MKKRIIAIVLAVMMFLSVVNVIADSGTGTVTANEGGLTDIQFSNGYTGYCIDYHYEEAVKGNTFNLAPNTSTANNNTDNSNISQALKALFVLKFEEIFDVNNNYAVKSIVTATTLPSAIWYLSDNYAASSTAKSWAEEAKTYDLNIPDEGYQITLKNNDVITFYFMVLTPDDSNILTAGKPIQDFFAYKFTVNETPASCNHSGGTATCTEKATCEKCSQPYGELDSSNHVDVSNEWSKSETEHWNKCACGTELNKDEHKGGTANCKEKAACETCGQPYGELNSSNHVGGSSEWFKSETEHWNKCACGAEINKSQHKGGAPDCTNQAECEICNEEYGNLDDDAHSWGDWKSNGDGTHTRICTLDDTHIENGDCFGGKATCKDEAVCEECGEKYGNVDKTNHVGETEVKDAKEATEFEEGYTGDTYCKSCGELIKKGTELPKLPKHEHSGGKATCVDKAVCEDENCGEKYGNVDKTNHVGETEVKDAKEATEFEEGYTGDTYCKSCGEFIEKGKAIPATHVHDFSEDWLSDKDSHWKECADEDCGEKSESGSHTKTEVRNEKPADEFNAGYTGDTYCLDCGELLETGTEIPATHVHTYSDKYLTDGSVHWKECECGDKTETDGHTFRRGICTVCEYEDPEYDEAPATGDDCTAFCLWSLVMTLSVCGIIRITEYKKRICKK